MTNMYEKIKADALSARKNRETLKASLLVTLSSEIAMVGKNAGREVTNDDCVTVIKKFLKGINEVIEKTGSEDAKTEKEILMVYMPKQLSVDEMTGIINRLYAEQSNVNPGLIMKFFAQNYRGLYDGAVLKKLADGAGLKV